MEAEPYPSTILFLWLNSEVKFGLEIVLLFIFVGLSALLSAAEVAYFSLTHQDIINLKEQNKASAKRALNLIEDPRHLLATLLVVNTILQIGIVLMLGLLLSVFYMPAWLEVLVQGSISMLLILFFSQLLPKIYGGQHAMKVAQFSSLILRLLNFLSLPTNFILLKGSKLINTRAHQLEATRRNAYSPSNHHAEQNQEEDSNAMQMASYARQDVALLKNYVNFSKKTVRTAMRSRADVVAVNITAPFEEIMAVFQESNYSRLPVYEEDLNHIKCVVYIKDMIAHINEKPGTWDWHSTCREVLYVPENKKLDHLLSDFQQNRMHFAVVIDEFGQTAGIITLEDILEELVGDIEDESDEPELLNYQRLDENTYELDSMISLNDLCELLHLPSDYFAAWDQEVDTLAGLILIQYGAMPVEGTIVKARDLTFTVLSANARKIETVQLEMNAV